MRVLLTRPWEESEQLAAALHAKGHEAIISPVLDIQFVEGPELALDGVQAIVCTSANGIRALARRAARRDVPLFAVGPQTASAAQSAGFRDVRNACGNARALADAVQNRGPPDGGTLMYAAGVERHHDFEQALLDSGYSVRTEILYDAKEVPALTREARTALSADALDAVMLFSSRSAASFAKQVQAAGLAQNCARLIAICISEAVADTLIPLRFCEMRIAAHPDRDAMLALLD